MLMTARITVAQTVVIVTCSRLTALWRYINFVLLLLLLWVIWQCLGSASQANSAFHRPGSENV